MPELPEVETVRRGLAPALEGARIAEVIVNRPDLRFPFPDNFVGRLTDAEVQSLARRGKYLLAPLSTGETLIAHLGMSGRFVIERMQDGEAVPGVFYHDHDARAKKHDHLIVTAVKGNQSSAITYNDPRRFGFVDLVPSSALGECRHFRMMGPEPLSPEFTGQTLKQSVAAKQTSIKAALLDQRVVSGLGNIYVCEALYRAGISPKRAAGRISAGRLNRLVPIIKQVLNEAIAAGGSSLRDFSATDGQLGYFQHDFSVYGREGAPCLGCGAPIRRITTAGRSTFYCSHCQR